MRPPVYHRLTQEREACALARALGVSSTFTPSLPTRIAPILRFVDSKSPGNSLMDTRTQPLKIKILLESNPLKSRILILRGGLLMSTGNFPETLSQRILAGIYLSREIGCSVKILLESNPQSRVFVRLSAAPGRRRPVPRAGVRSLRPLSQTSLGPRAPRRPLSRAADRRSQIAGLSSHLSGP